MSNKRSSGFLNVLAMSVFTLAGPRVDAVYHRIFLTQIQFFRFIRIHFVILLSIREIPTLLSIAAGLISGENGS